MRDKPPLNDVPDACAVGAAVASPAARQLRRFGPLALLAGAMLLIFLLGLHEKITLEAIVDFRERFHRFLADHMIVSVLAYVAVYIVAVALSVPCGIILTPTGGLLFGTLIGGAATVVGATIGATLLFLIARTALGESLSARSAPWLDKLREGFRKDAFNYMLFLRLVPAFPFWFVNVAPAVLGVPLKTYVLATVLGIIPATFAFASAGAGLDSVVAAAKVQYAACVAERGADACRLKIHASSLVTKELILALVLLGVVALIPVGLRRLKKWRKSHAAAK